jgi:hypothetical protein
VRLSGNDDFRLAVGDIDQGADGNLTVINIPPGMDRAVVKNLDVDDCLVENELGEDKEQRLLFHRR